MEKYQSITDDLDRLAKKIVDSAYQVHVKIGPGLLESVYEECMAHELNKRKIPFKRQCSIPIYYDGILFAHNLKLDMLVDEKIVIELKAVEQMNKIYEAQLLTYLKLSGKRLGFLINFNVLKIKDGITRLII